MVPCPRFLVMSSLFNMILLLVLSALISTDISVWAQTGEPQEEVKEETTMSCCPTDSWGKLEVEGYEPKGVIEKVGDLEMYRVGEGEKCIIWNYDIFGINSGRTKQTADLFAESGYMVIIPDYYRNGDFRSPWDADVGEFIKEKSNWASLEKDWKESILPYAESHGAKRFGTLGTCWGTYVGMRLSADPKMLAGVSWHPSHTPIIGKLGEDSTEIMKAVQCPQLIMPAATDPVADKTGGEHVQILEEGAGVEVIEFPDMQHGWTVRGDMSDPKVKSLTCANAHLSNRMRRRKLPEFNQNKGCSEGNQRNNGVLQKASVIYSARTDTVQCTSCCSTL
ncbi:hydrolase tropI isoform X2 [Eurytemora carolleeae]|uniref:hydrolase tropI isoform X2 n=1 Tax=Eurytemora carolleeae TaxID=1294199 RepID=UPI000C787512|nr:hydrolase tropI isoform X2 [Eurytemora carolleeae]|eukprot:XP_023322332.1 hydrolase tropI-like isoform X2 [Eurytemora affinis]